MLNIQIYVERTFGRDITAEKLFAHFQQALSTVRLSLTPPEEYLPSDYPFLKQNVIKIAGEPDFLRDALPDNFPSRKRAEAVGITLGRYNVFAVGVTGAGKV